MHLGELRITDRLAVDCNALIHAHEVGRGIEPGPVSSLAQNAGQSRGGGSLTIRAGHDHAREPSLRMAERFRQHAHVLEVKLAPRRLALVCPEFWRERQEVL